MNVDVTMPFRKVTTETDEWTKKMAERGAAKGINGVTL
jgi:hypothetical protein